MKNILTCMVAVMALGSVAWAQPVGAPQAAPAPAYRIIVNAQNPTNSVSRGFLSDAYLKKITRWKDGEQIQPVDLAADAPLRQRFAEEVLGRSLAALRSYWQQLIFSGRGIPPVELGNDTAVIRYVASHRGAVGYVSGAADVSTVKILRVQ